MTSEYTIVRFGYLSRGETMNIAVMAWDRDGDPSTTPVHIRLLKTWGRVENAFPRPGFDFVKNAAIDRLEGIKTLADYKLLIARMGPYTPFELREPFRSMMPAQETAEKMARIFLEEVA